MDRLHYHKGAGVGRVYIGAPYQQRAGIGSFLREVFRDVFPLLERSAKAAGKEALHTGVNIMSDVGERKTPHKDAFKARMRQSRENLQQKAKENLDRFMNGEGYKVRRSDMPRHLALALAKKRKGISKKGRKKKQKKNKKKRASKKKGTEKLQNRRQKPRRLKKEDFIDIFK